MDLDDFDDLEQSKPRQGPSRVSKFLPKSSLNKSVPKPEPDAVLKKPKAEEISKPKAEPSVSNGAVKMEISPASLPETELKEGEPMDSSNTELEVDEEDMIVREIDVFFTPSMDAHTQLYVMQYPLRPCWRPYELDERCEEVRVKPASAEVEIDLSVDVDSNNWNRERASSSSVDMPKQTLSSSWKPSLATGYAVGVLVDNKLHLNPIHAVVQLRPLMERLKSGGSKRKNNVTGNAEVAIKKEDSDRDKSAGSSKKQNKKMESSLEQNSNDEEGWVPLTYHDSRSDFSTRHLQRMLTQENSLIHFTMKPYDYVSSLCPGASHNHIKSKYPPRRFLLSLPLEERVKKLLSEGPPVHRFSALKHFVLDDSIEDVFVVLQKFALMVQGLWVPKSSFIFKENSSCFARDYTLLLFSENLFVKFKDIPGPPRVKELMKNRFLPIFSDHRSSFDDWKFKEPTDVSFINEYPEIVKKQQEIWASINTQITAAVNKTGKGASGTSSATAKPPSGNKSLKAMSNESREALSKALQKLFQIHKVWSKGSISQGIRDLALSKSMHPKADPGMLRLAAEAVDTEEFEGVLSQVATNIKDCYVSKSFPEHPELEELRNVVIELLRVKPKLMKADVTAAAEISLKGKKISTTEYNKVMSDICESKGSAWVLKQSK